MRRAVATGMAAELETVDPRRFLGQQGPWMTRLSFWSLRTPPVYAFNRVIPEAFNRTRPDVLWIEKGAYVSPRTMRSLHRNRSCLLVYHNTDEWRGKVRSVRVDHLELACHPRIVDPGPISVEDRRRLGAPIGFIGHREAATERMILRLVRDGIVVKIYGHNWEKAEACDELQDVIQDATVWGDECARSVLSFDINLGIVSAQNRSHTPTRTFQVPTLGPFLLHQRNELVSRYFEEDVEAELFDNDDELLEKCRHNLAHPEERARTAAAGQRRCRESGYSVTDRVREVLPVLAEALGDLR
jgi:hypothetical protein